jgi:predicted nucleotidyltransferase
LVAKTVQQHVANRDTFLEAIQDILRKDESVVAVWLTGSLGCQEADSFSDIDTSIVLSTSIGSLPNHARTLATGVAKAVNIHEARQNAPADGTMLSVLYKNGITVDWTFMTENIAARPSDSLLLFEKSGIRTGDKQN